MIDEIEAFAEEARHTAPDLAEPVWQASETLREATEWLVGQDDLQMRFAGSVPYLMGFARVLGGYFHLRAAMQDRGGSRERLARFYISRLLPEHTSMLAQSQAGAIDLFALTLDDLEA